MLRKSRKSNYILNIATVAMCVSILCISAWITIPLLVSFTLQILAISLISALFHARISIASLLSYIALGACGIPVFSAFGSGPAALLGPSGGFIFGFIFIPISVNLFNARSRSVLFCSMLIGLLLCYLTGVLWYAFGYASGTKDIISALSACVLPFIIPDIVKILIATNVAHRLRKHKFFSKLGGQNE